jgi:hypothetical protein
LKRLARTLCVYYRIDAANLANAAAAVRDFQTRLRDAHRGLQAALLRRPGEQDGEITLMETYAMPGGVDEALQARIDEVAAALAPWQRGTRHTEIFEPLT